MFDDLAIGRAAFGNCCAILTASGASQAFASTGEISFGYDIQDEPRLTANR